MLTNLLYAFSELTKSIRHFYMTSFLGKNTAKSRGVFTWHLPLLLERPAHQTTHHERPWFK